MTHHRARMLEPVTTAELSPSCACWLSACGFGVWKWFLSILHQQLTQLLLQKNTLKLENDTKQAGGWAFCYSLCLLCCGRWRALSLYRVHYLSGVGGLRVSPEPRSVGVGFCSRGCDGRYLTFFFLPLSRWHSLHNMPCSLMASQLNTLCHLHRCIHCLHYATWVTIHTYTLALPHAYTPLCARTCITRATGRYKLH